MGVAEGSSIWGRNGKRRRGGRRKGKGAQGTAGKEEEEKRKIYIFFLLFTYFFCPFSTNIYFSSSVLSLFSLALAFLILFSLFSLTLSRSPSLPPVSLFLSSTFFLLALTSYSFSLSLFLSPSLVTYFFSPSSLSLSHPSLPFSEPLGERVFFHSRHNRELPSERLSERKQKGREMTRERGWRGRGKMR
jgi:Zn-dependent protease with chaperone function